MKDENKVKGALARAESLTGKERSAIARRAALSRHHKDLPRAIAEGVLSMGDLQLSCAVLGDIENTRVLTQNGFLKAIGRHPFATGGTGSAIGNLAPFLSAKNLYPFISEDLERSATPIVYLPRNPTSGANGIGYGFRASLLPNVCWVYQDAMVAGKLLPSQLHVGEACKNFLKALTNYAIEDLIDKATGFDDIRKRNAINKIIERYCRPDALPWIRMFDLDFYRHIFRLNNWEFDPARTARPGVVGHWTNDIYDRLAPGVRHALHERVKRNDLGKPTKKLTQYLTPEEGKPRLRELLEGVKVVMQLSADWQEFTDKLNKIYPKYGDTLLLPFDQDLRSIKRKPKSLPIAEKQLS